MRISNLNWPLAVLAATLLGCGGGGGGSQPAPAPNPAPTTFTVGGTVSGLSGTVVLQNNASNDLTVSANGAFTFSTALAANSAYAVTIKTQPANQVCVVANGTGTIGASNVTNVTITCTTNAANTFSVGGTVSGLTGTVVLQNNAADDLTVAANGAFTFATPLATNSAYAVSIKTQPANQVCVVANGAGTIATSNVTNVAITCTTNVANTFSVSGTVTGLTGTLVLQNNAANDLTITANGTFTFSTALATNSPYVVSVLTQPAGQSCTLANAAGTIGQSNITDVAVTCTTTPPNTHTLGGTVTGLNGNSVVLQNNGGNDVTVSSTNPGFTFGSLPIGSAYALTVKTHPSFPAANCVIGAPQGTVADTDINDVAVTCTPLPVPQLSVDVDVTAAHTAIVRWPRLGIPVDRFNVYISTARECDFRGNFAACPAEKLINIGPGTGVPVGLFGGQPLKNGQPYFFQMETVYANGSVGLSNRSSARPNEVAFNSSINAIETAPNGTVYLGGAFTGAGVLTGSAVQLDRNNGRFTSADFPIVDGAVEAIAADGNGGWYVGGRFTHVGTEPRRNLAHIRADNSVDPSFTLFPEGQVHALLVVGSTLFVGGDFSQICLPDGISCSPRRNVAALTTSGSIDVVDWQPDPSGAVTALSTLGLRLYVGGLFPAGNGKPGFLAEFDLNVNDSGRPISSNPTQFDMGFNDSVLALLARDNALYVGGRFTQNGHCCLARIDFNGAATRSTTFNPDPLDRGQVALVSALALTNDGATLYFGGTFTTVQGVSSQEPRTNLAAVSTATGMALPWAPNSGSAVAALAVSSDGVVYVGSSGGNLAFDGSSAELSRNFLPDPSGSTKALALQGDMLYAGGTFNHLQSKQRSRLAAIDASGSLLPWNPKTNGVVNALAFRNATSALYVGGSFARIVTPSGAIVDRSNLAAIDGITGEVPPLQNTPNAFFGNTDGPVNALAILESAGALYVGGSYQTIATESVRNLAKLFLADGTVNPGFEPQPTGPVNALLATHDDDIGLDVVYAGGNFSDVRALGTTRNLVKLNADDDRSLVTWTLHPNGPVNALALSSDKHVVYAAGDFNSINNGFATTLGGLAALGTDGTRVLTGCTDCFSPSPENSSPRALAIAGLTVFAGGTFVNIGNLPIANFAGLTGYNQGAEETGFASGAVVFPNGQVRAIKVAGDKIYVGGSFSGFNSSINGASPGGARGNFAVVSLATGALVQ